MNLAHIHLLLNHFPTVGMIIGIGLFLLGLAGKSDDLKRASLVVFLGIALLTLPTYMSGNAAQEMICRGQAKGACTDPGVSKALIEKHEGAALLAFVFMEITGAFAWLGLWQSRRISRFPRWSLAAVALFSMVTFGLMAQAANIGGEIRHPEIREAVKAEAAQEAGQKPLARAVGSFVIEKTWVWATCETLHFVGLCLLFGIASFVDLRMLGFIKGVSFSALHRLLPWGVLGFGINMITGMFFFVAASDQYTTNLVYQWKLVLIMLAGLNVLYFTIFDEPWKVGAGDDAPPMAKFVAASAFVLVIGVIFCGRMLPFLGESLLMFIAFMVVTIVVGTVVAMGVVGYLVDKSTNGEGTKLYSEFLSKIEQLPFSMWILQGPYSTILFLHGIGMALVAGFAGVIALRLLGFSPKIPIKSMERLYPWMWWGFALNAVTGTCLLMGDATTKGTNPDFGIKMVFVFSGIIVLKIMRKKVFGDPQLDVAPTSGTAKGLAWISLVCWIGAITAGRLLAYVGPVSGLPGLKN